MSNQLSIAKQIEKLAEDSAKEKAKKAKYKIQIWFKSDRSDRASIAFSLSFWESGKRMHGGGDEMMFVCRRHADAPAPPKHVLAAARMVNSSPNGCGAIIPGDLVQPGGHVVCPNCQMLHAAHDIADAIFYRLPVSKAATVLADWWRKLESNADIYAKYRPSDPRVAQMAKNYDPITARMKKGLTIYPLERILIDTLHGATVESRMKAFILA